MWEDQLSRYIDELENEAYALSPEERAYFSFRPLALPTALTDRIPTEIYEIVIDSMDAGPMLAAAALVCTAWYPRAMYNLYHAIELRDRTSFTLLSKQYRTSPRVRKWLATTRELYAADRHNQIHDPSPQSKRTERGYFHVFPLTIGHVMYGLQNLTIKNFNSGTMPLTAFAALSRISSLKSLTLAYCMFSNISQLRRIICAFPQLQSLRLGDIFMVQRYAASTAGVDSTHPQSDVRLQNLAIGLNDTGASGTVIDWMLASGICTSLRRLSVWSVDPDGYVMEHVDRLLAATGPSITEYFEDLPLNHVNGNLIHNTALRSLDFRLPNTNLRGEPLLVLYSRTTESLRSVLSSVRGGQLNHIRIKAETPLYTYTLEDLSDVPDKLYMRSLHKVMAESYFDVLKDIRVEIMLLGMHGWDEADIDNMTRGCGDVLRGLFQPWIDRGIVNFSCRAAVSV